MGANIKKPEKNSQGFQQNEKKMPGPQTNPPPPPPKKNHPEFLSLKNFEKAIHKQEKQ